MRKIKVLLFLVLSVFAYNYITSKQPEIQKNEPAKEESITLPEIQIIQEAPKEPEILVQPVPEEIRKNETIEPAPERPTILRDVPAETPNVVVKPVLTTHLHKHKHFKLKKKKKTRYHKLKCRLFRDIMKERFEKGISVPEGWDAKFERDFMKKYSLFISTFLVSNAYAADFTNSYAIGEKTRTYCASDYFQYCKDYPVGSEAVRECMANVGTKLSKECIAALIEDGEIEPIAKEGSFKKEDKPTPIKKVVEKPVAKIEKVKMVTIVKQKPKSSYNYYYVIENGIIPEGINAEFSRN